jgi:neutral/alkaline ceramidase-like enzyme
MAMKIGFGTYDVTPPLGVSMCGYDKREGGATSLHDPLSARAMVFDDGTTAAALVVADVIGVLPEHIQRTVKLVSEWTGIPRGNVIAAGTHTHSGPSPTQDGRRRTGTSPNELFSRLLPDLMASAVKLAWDDRRVATLSAGSVHTRELTVNRREPGAVTDEELTVVQLKRRGGSDGVLLNYACHGVVMGPDNLALSGDWISLTRTALAATQPELFSLVAVSPSGDINPLPASIRQQMKKQGAEYFTNDPFSGIYDRSGGTFAEAEAMARSLARATRRGLTSGVKLATGGGIAAVTRTADIGRGRKRLRIPFRMIRVGQLILVGMTGEQFVETGLRVKEAVRAHDLIPVVLAHAPSLGYVPTAAAFAQHAEHDYEVDWARSMGMAEDAADRELAAIKRGLLALSR